MEICSNFVKLYSFILVCSRLAFSQNVTRSLVRTNDVTLTCNMAGFKEDVNMFRSFQLLKEVKPVTSTNPGTFVALASIELNDQQRIELMLPLFNLFYLNGGKTFNEDDAHKSFLWLTLSDMWGDNRLLYGGYMCRALYDEHNADNDATNWNKTFNIANDNGTQSWPNFNMTITTGLSLSCETNLTSFKSLVISVIQNKTQTNLAWLSDDRAHCSEPVKCLRSKRANLSVHLFDGAWQEDGHYQCTLKTDNGVDIFANFSAGSVGGENGNSTESTTNTPSCCTPATIAAIVLGVFAFVLFTFLGYLLFQLYKRRSYRPADRRPPGEQHFLPVIENT